MKDHSRSKKVDSSVKEKVKELSQQIDKAVQDFALDPKALFELFLFKAQFHTYSYKNAILIHAQREGAIQVASFKKWKDQGYQIRKGEHAIKILAPELLSYVYDKDKNTVCLLKAATPEIKELIKSGEYTVEKHLSGFSLASVFDISQTDCPIENYPQVFRERFVMGDAEHSEELQSALMGYCVSELGVSVLKASDSERANILRGARGVTIFPQADAQAQAPIIYYDPSLPVNHQIKTLFHETAHAMLHAPHSDVNSKTPLSRAKAEYQAELTAGICAQYFGIDSMRANAGYISGWIEDEKISPKEKAELVEQVLDTAGQIISYVDQDLKQVFNISKESPSMDKDESLQAQIESHAPQHLKKQAPPIRSLAEEMRAVRAAASKKESIASQAESYLHL
jgi:hypothetical protein